jgi:superfamily II DNA or RNA helicase
MITLKRHHAQYFEAKAENAKVRNDTFKALIWKHAKKQPNYVFSKAYKTRGWNGIIQVYKPNRITAGYIQETIDFLNNNSIEWQWENNEEPLDVKTKSITYEEFHDYCCKIIGAVKEKYYIKTKIKLEVRDYQIQAGYKFIKERRGIILHSTSAGKSLTIAFILGFLFYKKLIKSAIILVPLQSLVTQFYNDLIDFGFNPDSLGKLYSNEHSINKPIVVAMLNSARNVLDTLEEEPFFGGVDLVICDEVHKAAAKTVHNMIQHFTNAEYFFGCTGTLPESELDKEMIFSLFGEVIDKRKLKELQEKYEAVSPVKIGIMKFNYGMTSILSNAKRQQSHLDWTQEVDFLQTDNKFRNPYIAATIAKNLQRGEKIIVLTKNIEFGQNLLNLTKAKINHPNMFWIEGKIHLDDRDKILSFCRSTTEPYVVFTNYQVFSTGINIPNLTLLVCMDFAKSYVNTLQTIGRGVRKSDNKSEIKILDVTSDLKYSILHTTKRKLYYRQEGFQVLEKTIYPPNFDDASL